MTRISIIQSVLDSDKSDCSCNRVPRFQEDVPTLSAKKYGVLPQHYASSDQTLADETKGTWQSSACYAAAISTIVGQIAHFSWHFNQTKQRCWALVLSKPSSLKFGVLDEREPLY